MRWAKRAVSAQHPLRPPEEAIVDLASFDDVIVLKARPTALAAAWWKQLVPNSALSLGPCLAREGPWGLRPFCGKGGGLGRSDYAPGPALGERCSGGHSGALEGARGARRPCRPLSPTPALPPHPVLSISSAAAPWYLPISPHLGTLELSASWLCASCTLGSLGLSLPPIFLPIPAPPTAVPSSPLQCPYLGPAPALLLGAHPHDNGADGGCD